MNYFFSFFFAYFHIRLSPDFELGLVWPKEVSFFNPIEIPLLNSIILLLPGLTVTWPNYNSLLKKELKSIFNLFFLGIYFTITQSYEYIKSHLSISDSVFGSTFFLITGFYGIYVIIGTIFLTTNFTRLLNDHFSEVIILDLEQQLDNKQETFSHSHTDRHTHIYTSS